jgi:hypothetical protein
MIYVPIIIILVVLIIDYNYRQTNVTEKISNTNVVNLDNPEPWIKIKKGTKYNKYYIKINNINKYVEKFLTWKTLDYIQNNPIIDIDVDKDLLIIKSDNEEEALVLANLIINNFSDDIDFNEINSKIILKSIAKVKKYNLVGIKIKESAIEGLNKLNDIDEDTPSIDMSQINLEPTTIEPINNTMIQVIKNDIPLEKFTPPSYIRPYEGSEYASIQF